MPYKIKKTENGYKVCLVSNPSKCFSKNPLSKSKAEKQRTAIILSEKSRGGLQESFDGDGKFDTFGKFLEDRNLSEERYLDIVKARAEKEGYNPELFSLAQDNKHKIVYDGPDGIRKFGSVGYVDYIILSMMGRKDAEEHRRRYWLRHNKDIAYPKGSPAILSLKLLW